jgi:hypothetical protein
MHHAPTSQHVDVRMEIEHYVWLYLGLIVTAFEVIGSLVYVCISTPQFSVLFGSWTVVYTLLTVGNVWYTTDSLPDVRKAIRFVSSRIQTYNTFTNQMVYRETNDIDATGEDSSIDFSLMTTQVAVEEDTVAYLKHYKLIVTVWSFIKAFLAIPLGVIFTTKEIQSEAAIHVLFTSATLKTLAEIVNYRFKTELKNNVRYVGHGNTIFTTN